MRELQQYFDDPEISEIMINAGVVWIERRGGLVRTDTHLNAPTVAMVIERALGPIGRRVDRASPFADGRLPDGSRVHVVLPPVALDGPHVTIRRFAPHPFTLDDFADREQSDVLRRAVTQRRNLIVAGATAAGKTSLLNALARLVPADERIITIEDAAELRLGAPHVVRLESRPPNAEGVGEITTRELVRNALRMRPDRLVVGEVRGAEAFDMVQALNTGHDGSLSTCHANGVIDALLRLETMVLMADAGVPPAAVRQQLGCAVDVVVHVARGVDGRRRVSEIAAIGVEAGEWRVGPLTARPATAARAA